MTDTDIDRSMLPRLGISPTVRSDESNAESGLVQHPSIREVSGRTFAWNPPLAEAQAVLAGYLLNSGVLSDRDREIAILRHAWSCGSDYQWGMHAQLALTCGLDEVDVAALAGEADNPRWTANEAAIIQTVDELHRSTRVSDRTWNALRERYDERQIIELLVLIGSYRLIAYVFNSVGIRPPVGSSPDLPGNSFLFTDTSHDATEA